MSQHHKKDGSKFEYTEVKGYILTKGTEMRAAFPIAPWASIVRVPGMGTFGEGELIRMGWSIKKVFARAE